MGADNPKIHPFPLSHVDPHSVHHAWADPIHQPNDSSISSRTSTQLRNKGSISYSGTPHIHSQTASSPLTIANPIKYTHPLTNPTYHPKRHPDLFSRNTLCGPTDRQTDQQMVQANANVPYHECLR